MSDSGIPRRGTRQPDRPPQHAGDRHPRVSGLGLFVRNRNPGQRFCAQYMWLCGMGEARLHRIYFAYWQNTRKSTYAMSSSRSKGVTGVVTSPNSVVSGVMSPRESRSHCQVAVSGIRGRCVLSRHGQTFRRCIHVTAPLKRDGLLTCCSARYLGAT